MLEKLKESTGKAFAKVKEGTAHAAEKVKETTSPAFSKMKEGTAHVAEKVKETTSPALSKMKEGTVHAATKVKEGTVHAATKVKETTSPALSKVKEGTVHAATKVKEGTVHAATKVKEGTVHTAAKMKQNRTGLYTLYAILFIAAIFLVLYSMFAMHTVSLTNLFSVIPDIISMIPDILESFIFDYGFEFGFAPYSFLNFLVTRVLFRLLMPVIFIIINSAGLKHRRGLDRQEKSRTITAMILTGVALFLRLSSDFWYNLSYESSDFMDDEIFDTITEIVFGEKLGQTGLFIFYSIILVFLFVMLCLSLRIQKKRKNGEKVKYLGYFITCIVFAGLSFLLPIFTSNYLQSVVFSLSIVCIATVDIIGTSIGKRKKELLAETEPLQAPIEEVPAPEVEEANEGEEPQEEIPAQEEPAPEQPSEEEPPAEEEPEN